MTQSPHDLKNNERLKDKIGGSGIFFSAGVVAVAFVAGVVVVVVVVLSGAVDSEQASSERSCKDECFTGISLLSL